MKGILCRVNCVVFLMWNMPMTAQVVTSVRPETWKEQLEYTLKHHGEEAVKRRDGNETGLYLKGYTYRGTIDSERELEEVKSRLFSDVANTVCYYDNIHDAYDVVSVGLMRCLSGVMGRPVMIDVIRGDCEKGMHAGMETIELEWCRNGNTYRSWAVAEKGGRIVFENIGCLIADMESMVQCDRDSAESEREKVFEKSCTLSNLLGMELYSYRMYCRSSFGEDGILKSVQMRAKQSFAFGWHCSADIYTEDGTIDQDAYHLCHWKNEVTPPWGSTVGESGTFTHKKE